MSKAADDEHGDPQSGAPSEPTSTTSPSWSAPAGQDPAEETVLLPAEGALPPAPAAAGSPFDAPPALPAPAPAASTTPPGGPTWPVPVTPGGGRSGGSRTGLWVGLGTLLVAAIVVVVVVVATGGGGGGGEVEVGGTKVEGADEVLAEASASFADVVDRYGAASDEQTGCFWRSVDTDDGAELADAVCGPARFAAGGDWIEVPVSIGGSEDEPTVDDISFDLAAFTDPPDLDDDRLDYIGVDGAEPAVDADLAEPERGDRAYTADGRVIDGAADAVAAGTAALADLGDSTHPVNVHAEASCWLTDESDVGGSMVCGPVLGIEDDPTMPWRGASFSTESGPGPWAVTADPATVEIGPQKALPPASSLWHPDGTAPPSTVGFALPDPPAQAADYLAVTDADAVADVELTAAPPRPMPTPDYAAQLVSFGVAPRIGAGAEALLAPEGHQFVIGVFDVESTGDYSDDGSAAAVLVVDGLRRTLDDVDLWGYDTTRYALVASVPTGAQQVDLEFQDRGRAQSVSLLDGTAKAAIAGIERDGREIAVNATYTVSSVSADGVVQTSFTGSVSTAQLFAWNGDGQWAPDGNLLLYVGLGDPQPTNGESTYLYETDWSRTLGLVLADGTVVPPVLDENSAQTYGAPSSVYFEVPADAATATMSIARYGSDYDSRTFGEIETTPTGDPAMIALTL